MQVWTIIDLVAIINSKEHSPDNKDRKKRIESVKQIRKKLYGAKALDTIRWDNTTIRP